MGFRKERKRRAEEELPANRGDAVLLQPADAKQSTAQDPVQLECRSRAWPMMLLQLELDWSWRSGDSSESDTSSGDTRGRLVSSDPS